MPIHLSPISRREFLVRSVLAGTGVALGRRLCAADPSADPDTWALLADTHIAADTALVSRGVNMAENLAAVSGQLTGLERRPAGVLVGGDCAYLEGLPGDYASFVAGLDPVRAAGLPVHLLLGNHDNRDNFWAGVREAGAAERAVAGKHVAVIRAPRANWFLLDSLDQVNGTPGLLGEAQLSWLAAALDTAPSTPAIVFAHHNPTPPGAEPKGSLKDTGPLFEILAPRKQVKAYVFGHTHNFGITAHDSGIHLVNLPPVAYVFKEGRPNGWMSMTLRDDGAAITLHCLDAANPEHAKTRELAWRA